MTKTERNRIQKEIVDSIPRNAQGRLLLAPRVGKTKVMIDIIKRDKPDSILWVTPSAKLAEIDIPKEFETWKAKRYLKKLKIFTWASLNKITGVYDLIVLDEEQFATENNIENLLNGSLKGRILSMTGVPTKHIEKLYLYHRLNLKVLYRLPINEAVEIGLLSNYTIKVVQVPLSNVKNIKAGSKKKAFLTSEVKQYEWLSKVVREAIFQKRADIKFRILNRMRFIKNSLSKLEAAQLLLSKLEGRILLFAGSIKQAEKLCEHTYHSQSDDKKYQMFQKGEIQRIAMVNSGGTGHTYKEIDHLIMVQADSDKNGLTSQKVARTLLAQKDYKATIWIISLVGTQDEKWVDSALDNFDRSKVQYIKLKDLKNGKENRCCFN